VYRRRSVTVPTSRERGGTAIYHVLTSGGSRRDFLRYSGAAIGGGMASAGLLAGAQPAKAAETAAETGAETVVFLYANTTPGRVPFSDLYDTIAGDQVSFQARPVQGGMFALLALKQK
jgi:hypothetical protein